MSKVYLVSVGYYKLVTSDPNLAVAMLECEQVEEKYIAGESVFEPTKDKMEVKTVDSSKIRPLTKEEKENKELAEAKNSAEWEKKRNEELRKEVDELKCQLKVALKSREEESHVE